METDRTAVFTGARAGAAAFAAALLLALAAPASLEYLAPARGGTPCGAGRVARVEGTGGGAGIFRVHRAYTNAHSVTVFPARYATNSVTGEVTTNTPPPVTNDWLELAATVTNWGGAGTYLAPGDELGWTGTAAEAGVWIER